MSRLCRKSLGHGCDAARGIVAQSRYGRDRALIAVNGAGRSVGRRHLANSILLVEVAAELDNAVLGGPSGDVDHVDGNGLL